MPQFLPGFLLELQPVCNHGDEFAIGGFSFCRIDGVAEILLQGVQIASVPSHLDGVANGPLHPAGSSAKPLGHFRIEHLGDGGSLPCL